MRWSMICLSIILLVVGNGCHLPLKISYDISQKIDRKLLRIKNSKQVIIKAIMIEMDISESKAIILWDGYQKSKTKKISTLAEYMIDIKLSPESNGYSLRDDIFISFVERVKERTKILKRGYYAR